MTGQTTLVDNSRGKKVMYENPKEPCGADQADRWRWPEFLEDLVENESVMF